MPDNQALRVALAALALVLGWGVGWLSARYTNGLLQATGDPLPEGERGWLLDRWVQIGCALAWALLMLHYSPVDEGPWRWLASAALTLPLVQITVTDLRRRIVFTHLAYGTTVAGLVLSPVLHPASSLWESVLPSVLGTAGGYLAFAFLYWIGKRLYRGVEAMAWGDVLIAGMVGAITGPFAGLALIAGVLLGGVMAIVFLVAQRGRRAFMPYGPGLCMGAYLSFFMSLPGTQT